MLTAIEPNLAFSKLASDAQIERAVKALEANGIHALVAANGEAAKKMVFDLLPEGAEVFTATSLTLETIGVLAELQKPGRYDSVRSRLAKMDDKTQHREMVKLGATPEYVLGSVHAVTEDGSALIASMSGSQLAPYTAAASKV